MQPSTMLSAAVHSLLSGPISGLISATFTQNSLNFLALFGFIALGIFQLWLALQFEPYPGPWYRLTLYIIVTYCIVLHFAMQVIIPDTPQDFRRLFSAIQALCTKLSTETQGSILVLGSLPCQFAVPWLAFFRRPTKGARSCPWAVWAFWCYGCHYLLFASLYIEEPERNPVLYSSARYIFGIAMLAGLYHKLQLLRLNKLMIILSTVPALSHMAGKFWEEVLQGTACSTGLRPYLVGYALASGLFSSLYFWYHGDLGANMDPDLPETAAGDKGGEF